MALEGACQVVIFYEYAGFEVGGERSLCEVGGSDERAAAVNYEELGVEYCSDGAEIGGPAPAVDPRDGPERFGLVPGVGAGAVFFGFKDDIDLAATADRGFKIGGDFGQGVGRKADDQDALGGSRNQLMQHRAGQPLLAAGSGAGPDGARSPRISVAAGAQPDPQREPDALPGELRARSPSGHQAGDRVMRAWWCAGGDLGDSAMGSFALLTCRRERLDLPIAQALENIGDGALDAHVTGK